MPDVPGLGWLRLVVQLLCQQLLQLSQLIKLLLLGLAIQLARRGHGRQQIGHIQIFCHVMASSSLNTTKNKGKKQLRKKPNHC